MIKTNIELDKTYYDRPGKYSDGVFYLDNVFYTIDSEFTCTEVLDLSERDYGWIYVNEGVYVPYFENGVCTLITEKNDKFWIFDIDKEGNMLTEPEEFDITLLSE